MRAAGLGGLIVDSGSETGMRTLDQIVLKDPANLIIFRCSEARDSSQQISDLVRRTVRRQLFTQLTKCVSSRTTFAQVIDDLPSGFLHSCLHIIQCAH